MLPSPSVFLLACAVGATRRAAAANLHGDPLIGSGEVARSLLRRTLRHGGIGVLMLPNGTVFHYFGDGDDHEWLRSAREAYKLK